MVLRSEAIERVSAVHTCEARPLLSTRNFQRGCVSQTISEFGKVSRSAETAGNVCTISPSEPRRTTRKRGSGMRGLAHGFEKIARGVIFWIADDGNSDSKTLGSGAFRHSFDGVVGAFSMNVRAKIFEQRLNARLAKPHDVIDGSKRGDEESASLFREDGTARTFQSAYARIRVDADDEDVAFAARAFQKTDVADVKRIETTVGKNDALTALLMLRQFISKALAGNDLGCSVAHESGGGPAGLLTNGGEQFIATDGSRAAFHDNETAGDVGNVRGFEGRSAAG